MFRIVAGRDGRSSRHRLRVPSGPFGEQEVRLTERPRATFIRSIPLAEPRTGEGSFSYMVNLVACRNAPTVLTPKNES
jgi:hypothetical protein